MKQAADKTQAGTSEPRPAAMSRRPASSLSKFHSRRKPRSAAAASAEPPPIPDATGKFLVRVSFAPFFSFSGAPKARAARNTRLSPSPSNPLAKGPRIVSDRLGALSISSTSAMAVNTARLCSG